MMELEDEELTGTLGRKLLLPRLGHEHVVHRNDVDVVDAPLLELLVGFDVAWHLCGASPRERARHAHLQNASTPG